MANKPVIMNSAARCRIIIDGKVIAYAFAVSYNISRNIIRVNTIGEYGNVAIQPGLYMPVRLQLRVHQLLPQEASQAILNTANNNETVVNGRADSTGQVDSSTETPHLGNGHPDKAQNNPDALNENMRNMFDPAKLLFTSTFDVEICQYFPVRDGSDNVVYAGITTLKDCRFDQRNINLPLGQLATKSLGCTGLLAVNKSPSVNADTGAVKPNEDKILEETD